MTLKALLLHNKSIFKCIEGLLITLMRNESLLKCLSVDSEKSALLNGRTYNDFYEMIDGESQSETSSGSLE